MLPLVCVAYYTCTNSLSATVAVGFFQVYCNLAALEGGSLCSFLIHLFYICMYLFIYFSV